MEGLTVKELIAQLQRFDADKIVYIDDTLEGEMVGLRGAYGIEAENSVSQKHLDGHVYLGMDD